MSPVGLAFRGGMPKPLYTISSHGLFNIDLVPHRRCGASGTSFKYEVEVTVDALDADGFVFNGDQVPAAFARFNEGKWEASCEDIAGGVIYVFRKLCGSVGREIKSGRATRIMVRVHPNETRNLTVVWERGWDLPERFPVRRNLPATASRSLQVGPDAFTPRLPRPTALVAARR